VGPGALTVISRSSRLARAQTEEALNAIRSICPAWSFTTKALTTPGDRDQSTPLTDTSVPDDFFTRDLDEALLDHQADIAVHSAKDLPQTMHPDLCVIALLPARDIRDAVVYRPNMDPDAQPATIGTSSPKRNQMVGRIFPDAQRIPLRGTIEERLAKLDEGALDAIVVAACALERLKLQDRICGYFHCDPVPQQGRLAIVIRKEDQQRFRSLRALDVRRTAGLVAIIGCPTDHALLCARAMEFLERADVVLHDRLIPETVREIIQDKAIFVGKTGGEPSTPQSEIHRLMLHEAEKGHLVVRLQGGDPQIFGHLSGQLAFLTDWNLRAEVVPAVTAAQVASSRVCAGLTHRLDGGHVHILSGHTSRGGVPDPLPGPEQGNLAIYMGVSEAPEMAQQLRHAGWREDTTVVIAERLGFPHERVRTVELRTLPELDIMKPAIFLVGVQAYPMTYRTLFTGTDPSHFLRYGPLIHWPVIQLISKPVAERAALLTRHLPECDGILFPSRHAVQSFMEALHEIGDARSLHGKKLLAVGPATSQLLKTHGLSADACVDSFGGIQALVRELPDRMEGSFLYPCSDVAPTRERVEILASHGITACPLCFYENRAVKPDHALPESFQRVLFTSSSTAKAYFDFYPEERHANRDWLAVGPSTFKTLSDMGLEADMIQSSRDVSSSTQDK